MKQIRIIVVLTLVSASIFATFTKKVIHPINASKQFVLACDISVNSTKVGLFEVSSDKPKLVLEYADKTKEIKSLPNYIESVLKDIEAQKAHVSVISIAGPGVVSMQEKTILHPHLPWNVAGKEGVFGIDGQEIEKVTRKKLLLLNDFEAGSSGVQVLNDADIVALQEGSSVQKGTKVVIGAGAGLGVGILIWDDANDMYKPFPLNYSFTEFGAHSALELKYYDYLEKNIGINAWGKVLGGQGGVLEAYKFLDTQLRYKRDPFVHYEEYQDVFKNRHTSLRCKDAVDFYMKLYIRMIRNVAYALNPTGGVYITNSIAENNPELFEDKEFIKELVDFNPSVSNGHTKYLKGYLMKLPIYLVKGQNLSTALYGAALYAQKHIAKV